jgi:hypothetical protein
MAKDLAGVTDKDTRALLRKAIKAGCTITTTGSNHIRVTCPSGEYFYCALTTSDRNSFKYVRRDLRDRGVAV